MYIIITISAILLLLLLKRAHTRYTINKCKPVIAQVLLSYMITECTMNNSDVKMHLIDGMNAIGVHSEKIQDLIIRGTLKELGEAELTFNSMKSLAGK